MTAAAERFLVFDLNGSRYALPLVDVAEVLEPVPTFPIPRAAHFLLGAINFHGRIVAVLDLATLLQSGAFGADGKYVVLDRDQTGLALACGPTVNIIPAEVVLEEEPADSPFVERILVLADGEVRLLHMENLMLYLEELLHG
jgi:purine-binding chemotaxis protein CheW